MFATFTTYYFHSGKSVTGPLLFEAMSLFFIIRIEAALLFPISFQLMTESYIGCKRVQVKYFLL